MLRVDLFSYIHPCPYIIIQLHAGSLIELGISFKTIDADEYGMGEYVQGVGRQILNQGIYEGQFKNEFKHGYGRHIWDDGEYYVG